MADRHAQARKDFNAGAVPVLAVDRDVFLRALGGDMCAVGVKAEYGVALDVVGIQATVERHGGHLTAVRETHLYAWVNADAIRELAARSDLECVTPYRNWTDPNQPPVRTMPRPEPR